MIGKMDCQERSGILTSQGSQDAMNDSRYKQAIERNLAELQRAILNRSTLVSLGAEGRISHLFLKLIYFALFNDYIAHCIKVFERGSRAASFWYIYRTDRKPLDGYARRNNISVATLEQVSKKLTHLRNKTHFHIDKEGVFDPKAVWLEAGLSGSELSNAVDAVWNMLNDLQTTLGLAPLALPDYNSAIARRVAILVEGGQVSRGL